MSVAPPDLRPPPALWPDRIYTLPELQYSDTLNLSAELVDVHVDAGRGAFPAIVFRDERMTYLALQDRVGRIGNALRGIGIGPGDRVMLRIPNRPDFFAVWLAVQRIGAVTVSTMPMLKARELRYMIEDSGACAIVVAGDLLGEVLVAVQRLPEQPTVIVTGSDSIEGLPALDALAAEASADLEPHPTRRDAPALIAYTSGSTGTPKGACHSPSDVLATADTYSRHVLAPDPADVFGGHPTLAFTYGLGGLLVFPLRAGAATVISDAFTPQKQLELVARERITLLFCAATTYRLLLQVPDLEHRYDLSSLRYCVSAGEPLPRPVYEEWVKRTGIEILDSLGTTEMFQIFICAQPGRVRPGATGEIVPGYEARIVDDRMNDLPRGTPGLLAVRGPTGCRYWNKPDRQREYVRDGWNVPNDICVQDADGYFYYQCRNDDLIICAGYNIAGPEIEAVLLEHPAVLEAAVVASPDATKGHVPKAFVVLKPDRVGTPALADQLREHVKRELAPYKYPRKVEFITELPKTETGKIRRVELRQRELK